MKILPLLLAAAIAGSGCVQGATRLLSEPVDVSHNFTDVDNIYFFADSLIDFDTATGQGRLQWKRHQLMPRQAFNTNVYWHQPLTMLDFPDAAYENDPTLDFVVEPITPNTLRVRIYTSPVKPDTDADDPMLVSVPMPNADGWNITKKADGTVVYASAGGTLEVQPSPWRIVVKDAKGKVLTRTRAWVDNDSTQVKGSPFGFVKRGEDNARMANPVFSLMPGEKIVGFGESAMPLNKVGQKVNLFVTDPQGPETPGMYKPIPFFMSNRGYGMFLHTSAPVTADVGASYIGDNKLFMADEVADMFIFFGSPKEILSQYTALTGRPEMPPLWTFGTWMSRITYFSEAEGREVARQLRAHRIPSDVIHFDTGWFGTDWQCDYQFAAERFNDPKKMLSDMKAQGFHTCLWQLPYFTPKNRFYPELIENKMFVANGRGQLPYEDAVLDFTNPATVEWYQGKLAGLLSQGVGAIKVDFGEAAPLDGHYANGRSGLYEHNLYPLRYNKAVADITKKTNGEAIIWARSAWAGSQRYPLHWGGDAATTAAGLNGTLRAGLSLGLSGFSFWSHDIGGFVTASPEGLYRRWLPFGMLTSHSRVHGAPPTEPWLISEEFTDYFRRCAELKYALMPYVYTQARVSAENGWPMLRALAVEYPDDPGAWTVDDQYLFGSQMLVAPLMEDGLAGRDVYLPGGHKWIDYQTGRVYNAGWQYVEVADADLPIVILVADGAAIPHVPVAQSTADIDWDAVTITPYASTPEATCHGRLALPGQPVKEITANKR